MRGFFSLRRLLAMLGKEFIQMRRDRITFAMMLGIPIVQLILFGYAINNDPRSLPTAVAYLQNDRYSRAIISALETSDYFEVTHMGVGPTEANELLVRGDVTFVLTLPHDLGTRIERGESPSILMDADATDPAAASGAISALPQIVEKGLRPVMPPQSDMTAATNPHFPEVVVHRLYNPESITQYNVVPALLGVILQLTMVMMTSIALTREIERGTMENLLSLPASPIEIMLGKVLPYLAVGAVQILVILTAGKILFSIPYIGSIPLLLGVTLIFVLALVLLGYFISTLAKTQMQALQMTFFFFLPSLLLSGFMFPYKGMPDWAQTLGEIFPLTHFLRAVRGILLKGAELSQVTSSVQALSLFVVVFAAMALLRFKRTLD
ncbi:ABC transporter permease [Rhodobacteraceae bacterium RKSG542]|uniref:ABC transporter permease n=1 Tax=Pseudovibrio flavus TaxID=2529854 RepID=UPI0012BC776F|nr:ABC transporter permease [Pseudovibrio flavus]MTI17426.1 ABC transporter permease [Pseudovibrio flavus]